MNTVFRASFLRDVRKLRDAKVQRSVAAAISNVEQAHSINQVRGLKRLSGHRDYYRIRIGDWRLGLIIQGEVISFVRCLNRREVYRYFP
jgi:mRNA interferase RelE/StbE